MAGSRTLDLLQRVPFLHGIEEQILLELAAALPLQNFAAGETLFEQGERADCLYLLISGRVSLTHFGPEGESLDLGERLPPDMLGAQEMVYRQPRTSTARAQQETTALCWSRDGLSSFMKDHPDVLGAFQFLATGERMAASQQLNWLRPGEVVYAFARRHRFVLYQRLTVPLLLLAVSLLLLFYGLSSAASLVTWAGAGLGLAGLLYAGWQFMDWRNDYFRGNRKREVMEHVEPLRFLLHDGVKTLTEAALRFCLSDSRVSTVIVGMRKTEHVEENCAVSDGKALPPDDLKALQSHVWPHNYYF